MKIRNSFAILAGSIVLIPIFLLSLLSLAVATNHFTVTLPDYKELAPEVAALTDSDTWNKVCAIVGTRPDRSATYVFDQNFHLIYGTRPMDHLVPQGKVLTVQESLLLLRGTNPPSNMLLFQPTGTKVWILFFEGMGPATNPLLAERIRYWSGVGLLVLLLGSVLASLVLGSKMSNAVVRLEKAAQRIAQGDLRSPVPAARGNDEVRSLGRALDQMRLALLEEEARQTRFVMGVSHDLKSPLALIKGYVELLKDGPPGSAQARESHFDLILDKVDQLDGMIDQLIDYSKVNTGEWQQTWRPLKFRPFLEEFCQVMGTDAQLLGRTLEASLEVGAEWEVSCDPRSIRRCLENLVHNALRYIPEGGTVGIRARETPEGLELVVWDNGPGLSAQDLPHLFELFYRGTHSRRESGMGLGLSVVKTILDSHGWTIRAESDRGARFIITVPAASPRGG